MSLLLSSPIGKVYKVVLLNKARCPMSWLFGIDTIIESVVDAITPGSEPTNYDSRSDSGNHDSRETPEYNIWGQPTNDAARAERESSSKGWWD